MISTICPAFCKAVTGVQPRWQGCSPQSVQRIYFANHSSNLDFLVIWSSLPKDLREKTRPVAAADYWLKTRARRYLADNVFRALLIERSGAGRLAAFQTMLKGMADGSSLIIFPEGSRNPGMNVADFKSGLYFLARERSDVELVPTYLENLNRILPKGEKLLVPLLCSVTFGAPIRSDPDESKKTFLNRAKAALEELKT